MSMEERLPQQPRERKPIKVQFDPFDINFQLRNIGFLGSENQANRAKLELGAGGDKPPSEYFGLIFNNRNALIADGFEEVEFNGRTWKLNELTSVEEMKQKIERERVEAEKVLRLKEEEEKKRFISGSASQIDEDISHSLRSNIPRGAKVITVEESESQTTGYGMGEQDQYRGKLVVKLVYSDGREDVVLANYYSPWTNENPASARYYVDRTSYSYRLDRDATIKALVRAISSSK